MVNHLRTLLLNLAASPDAAGEEFIESTFRPNILTSAQSALHSCVFPASFDRTYRNFIATLLTRLALDSPLAPELLALDPRTLLSDPALTVPGFTSSVTVERLASAASVRVTGSLTPQLNEGRFSRTWLITRTDSDEISLQSPGFPASLETVTFSANSSLSIRLEAASSLLLRLADVSAVPSGLRARVTATAPMSYDLFALLQRLQNSPNLRGLFSASTRDLQARFDNDSHPEVAIAAALMAYALSFEEVE